MGEFSGKKIIITGTSKGIGYALAQYFARNQAVVYAVSRNVVEYSFDNIIPIIGDINNYLDIVEQIKKYTEQIDILINNAGIMYYKNIIDSDIEEIQKVFSTNVISTIMFSNLISKMMICNKTRGVIINTISFAANIPSVGSGIYAATKASLLSLTKTMAAELAPYGIRVNGYSPGVIETEMTRQVIQKDRESIIDAIALHRIGTVNDVLDAVAFLASEKSSYITGINLDVSGGKYIVQNAGMEWKSE